MPRIARKKEAELEVTIPIIEEVVEEVEQPTIDEEAVEVDLTKQLKMSKIKMREDHRCCIAMERYDLKKGKTYNVPDNVKRILEHAGLLAPL